MHIIDRPSVKLLLRVIGVPLSVLALLGAIDGIALLLGGIEHNNPWALFFGLGSLGAGLGLAGAWLRISKEYHHLSKSRVRVVRWLLPCGILGAAFLAVGTYGIFGAPPRLLRYHLYSPRCIGCSVSLPNACCGMTISFVAET
jgi:hypothetical protein